MKKYVSKPEHVEAFQWFLGSDDDGVRYIRQDRNLDGKYHVICNHVPIPIYPGDWVVVQGKRVRVFTDEEFQYQFMLKVHQE